MSFEVRITQAAWVDAEQIYEWIRDSGYPLNAQRWFNAWLERVRSLETFPAGRSRAPEDGSISEVEVYQQLFGAFRTLYVVRGSLVLVIHVRRASRSPASRDDLLPGLEEAEGG
jgi:plasmid stabilization system protein ParE